MELTGAFTAWGEIAPRSQSRNFDGRVVSLICEGRRHTRCSRTAWPDALRGAHSEGICSESPATRSRRVYVYRSDVVHMVSDKVGHALAVRYATREKNGVYVAL